MTTGIIQGVTGNLVAIKVDGPVGQNEVGYVITRTGERLMAEVIKITRDTAFAQVYESTRGLRFGDKADFSGHQIGRAHV